jgi:hypothetical protein
MLVQRTLTGFFAVVIEMHSQSQHGRITASRLFRPAFVRLSSMALYAAKVNGNYASSLSRSSTFVVSQENCRHAEKYKMAPCYEFFDFCSKQQQLGIYIHVGFVATTATVFTPEGGASSASLFSALNLMKSAHLTDVSIAMSQSTRKYRLASYKTSKAKNHFRPARMVARSSAQNKRSDSGLELVSPSTQPKSMTRQEQEGMLLAALPVNVRAEIYQGAFARNEPVDFVHYFNSLDFEFDLRTPNGVSDFHAWHANLGSHACHVTSLTLKHWITYWSFTNNAWTTSEDRTHFARGSQGDLIMFRAMLPTASETCECGLPYLLAQHDQVFDLKKFGEIGNMMHFINCLRADGDEKKPTRVDAASTFASMLEEHSQLLFQDYARSRRSCTGCFMQRLYLTGHLSTSTNKGSDVVFNALALSKSSLM